MAGRISSTRQVGPVGSPELNFRGPAYVGKGVRETRRQPETARRAADTDAGFVRALYVEHGAALLGYTIGLIGDRGRAEDIVQETVLRAWRHADQLDADGRSVRPWLYTVAAHLAVDQHRARRTRPAEVGEDILDNLPAAEDDLERAMQGWQVADALRTLSDQHRAVLMETYYRGRSVREAAAVLGVPIGTVKSRSYYALRALRLALQERGWSP